MLTECTSVLQSCDKAHYHIYVSIKINSTKYGQNVYILSASSSQVYIMLCRTIVAIAI